VSEFLVRSAKDGDFRLGVMTDKTQREHNESAHRLKADVRATSVTSPSTGSQCLSIEQGKERCRWFEEADTKSRAVDEQRGE
jgi:hypothetical protein